MAGETFLQLLKARGTGFAGEDAGLRVALGQDQRLAAGRGAGIQNAFYFLVERYGSEFGNQLRALILKTHAALLKCRGCGHVAGDDGARRGEQFSGFKDDAGLGQFCLNAWRSESNGEQRLALAVAADCAR